VNNEMDLLAARQCHIDADSRWLFPADFDPTFPRNRAGENKAKRPAPLTAVGGH